MTTLLLLQIRECVGDSSSSDYGGGKNSCRHITVGRCGGNRFINNSATSIYAHCSNSIPTGPTDAKSTVGALQAWMPPQR